MPKKQAIPKKVAKARELRKKGLSFAAIGRNIKVSKARAFEFCTKDPKSFKGKPGRPVGTALKLSKDQVRKAKLVYFYAPDPPSIRELARRHGVSKGVMERALFDKGGYKNYT